MTDRAAIDGVTADCERYWKAAGISGRMAREMRHELERHLMDAADEGRDPRSVVGADVAAFAKEWASEQRRGNGPLPTWDEALKSRRRRFKLFDVVILLVVAGGIAAALATRSEGGSVDNETWRWIWVGAALFLTFAEIMTAGFFMLPFAAGAVAAAVLAFAGVDPAIQLAAFIGLSVLALIVLQRFVRREDEKQSNVGANRFVGQRALVVEDVDRTTGGGRVRMDTELWRATTDEGPIPEGTEVKVVEVRGTRLVVELID